MAIVGYPIGMYSWNAVLDSLNSTELSSDCFSVASFMRLMDPKNPYDISRLIRYDHLYEACIQSEIDLRYFVMHLANELMHANALDFSHLPKFEALCAVTEQDAFNKLCTILLKETDMYV